MNETQTPGANSIITVELGRLTLTRGVQVWRGKDFDRVLSIMEILGRHEIGDWGDADAHDASVNDAHARTGGLLVSQYRVKGIEIWIITEADRSRTTVLFPHER